MCLFPLLQGLIGTAQVSEKALEVYRRRKGPRQRDGVLHEHERLFIAPRVQQSIGEVERPVDVYPSVLDSLVQSASALRPLRMLCCTCPSCTCAIRQHLPAQGFCRTIRQGLGERRTSSESAQPKAPAKRSARGQGAHRAPGTLPEQWHGLLKVSSPADGSIQARRDFWLPVPGRVCLVPGRAHARP